MRSNHPETTPRLPQVCGKLSSMQLVPGAKMLGTTVLEDQVWQKGCRGAGMGVGRPERSLPLRRRLPGGVWGFTNPSCENCENCENLSAVQETQETPVQSLSQEDTLEKEMTT